MKRILGLAFCMFAVGLLTVSCSQGFLSKSAPGILSAKDVFSDPNLIKSNIANLYNRIHQDYGINQAWNFANFDDAFYSNFADYFRFKNQSYTYNFWSYWDYGYLHDINLFIDRIRNANQITRAKQMRFLGGAQFLRAYFYFNEVKAMGGVPMLLDTLKYNFSGNGSYLDRKRAPEYKVYNFVIAEADSAAKKLPKTQRLKIELRGGQR